MFHNGTEQALGWSDMLPYLEEHVLPLYGGVDVKVKQTIAPIPAPDCSVRRAGESKIRPHPMCFKEFEINKEFVASLNKE